MDIKKLLQEVKGVDGWRVSTTKRASYELFFVHKDLETVRSTDTVDTTATVYVSHDGKLGSSDFAVYGSMTEAEAAEKIAAAAERAKLVFNEPWDLPQGGQFSGEMPSNFKDYEPKALAKEIADAAFAADDMEGGSINALEIFLYRDTVTVQNSQGVDKTQVKYHAMVEAIPTWNENGESVELYENYCFTQFDPAAVTQEIAGKMREVRDRYHAKKPETPLRCGVLLRPQEIVHLLSSLTRDLNYSSVYNHSNLHKVGDDLQPGSDCDKLNVTARGALSGSTSSAYFDEDGTDLRDRALIVDGKAASGWGSARFAQYLGEEPTGSLRCLELSCGTLGNDLPETYLECVSLSGLQLDLYNDYIGGEIRLAYLHKDGEVRPVTGISMSASLSKALSQLRLSQEEASIDGYRGPARALLPEMSIL